MTQKPDPKRPTVARASQTAKKATAKKEKAAEAAEAAGEDREAQLRDLTEQCLELMDRLAEAGEERDRLRERCGELEDELARDHRDTLVSRERLAWLEEIQSEMHKTSEHIKAQGLDSLKHQTMQAAQSGPPADLEERFERLGKGIDLEHQLKSGLINVVNALQEKATAARNELIELAAKSGASEEEQKRIKAELEQERSSRQAAMDRLREDGTTIRELRAILGISEKDPASALTQWIRNLQAQVNDRDRWVAALLSELANRRLKITRRGLMDHERKFLEERERRERARDS